MLKYIDSHTILAENQGLFGKRRVAAIRRPWRIWVWEDVYHGNGRQAELGVVPRKTHHHFEAR